ncbi:MAG: nucleoside triphosphate pyrophosphohydrolase [Actinomycetota bacterium]
MTTGDGVRSDVPDGPVPSGRNGEQLLDLIRVMARLRAPGGCPWDREQDHRSLAKHLLEETHEVIDAIDSDDAGRLRDELGDLLLQVVFHAEIAREEGEYDIDDVAEGIVRKLIRRHPHVFGDAEVDSAGEVLVNWERIKSEEKGEHGVEHDIPKTLPALARASKVQRRAAGSGFEWRTKDAAMAKLREEVGELDGASPENAEEELGEVLFAAAAVARSLGVDPESALRRTTTKFANRYESTIERAKAEGVDLSAMSDVDLLAYFRNRA